MKRKANFNKPAIKIHPVWLREEKINKIINVFTNNKKIVLKKVKIITIIKNKERNFLIISKDINLWIVIKKKKYFFLYFI